MIAYHYSNKLLSIGDIITSNQHKGSTFELVRSIYSKVKPLPEKFGYAYPQIKMLSFKYEYEVEAENYIKGNFNYSVYLTMDRLPFQDFADKKITLKERLVMREKFIFTKAEIYFKAEYEDTIELISDSWVVKKVNTL